jgi:hypothetical protein
VNSFICKYYFAKGICCGKEKATPQNLCDKRIFDVASLPKNYFVV